MPESIHHPRYVTLRNLLKAMREDARLTQKQLAELVGVTQSFLSKIERGDRYVDVLFFVDWCEACGCQPTDAIQKLTKHTT